MNTQNHNIPRLLLHACCGPCSLEPTRSLQERGFQPTIYFANSNIHPAGEYARRLETLQAWASGPDPASPLPVVEGSYDVEAWERTCGRLGDAALAEVPADADRAPALAVDPEKRKARCRLCYRMRFEEAARYAADHGFQALGTTLSVSPYQYTDVIREELERAAAGAGIQALFEDYRPYYDEATRRSRDLGMYRQNNCGCRFSIDEAEAERAERKEERRRAREAQLAATADQRAAEEAARQAKKAEKAAYAEKQRRKKAALKALRSARPQGDGQDGQTP
ncbi:MAG: epoxyqueuosine reductase QueH [Coriobacteriia bacterium]|nr:epoxyqueuosine reductase QueH [Coriobacteriia bacterium]